MIAIVAVAACSTLGAFSATAFAQDPDELVDDTTELIDDTTDVIDDPICVTDCEGVVPTPDDDGGDGGGGGDDGSDDGGGSGDGGGDDGAEDPIDTVTEPVTGADDDTSREEADEDVRAASSSSSASTSRRTSRRSSTSTAVAAEELVRARAARETQGDVAFGSVLGDTGYTAARMPAWASATDANSNARPGSFGSENGRTATGDVLALAILAVLLLVAAGERYVARR